MKKWILAVAALNFLTFSAAEAGSPSGQTKTVITIEQDAPRAGTSGVYQPMPGENVAPPVVVDKDGTRVEIDKESGNMICPCPYSMNERGQMCGEKSIYSKNKGTSPDCYAKGGANPDMPVNNIYLK